MRWMLEVAFIGLSTSWKWLLGSTAAVAILVGLLFGVGVLGGGDSSDTDANGPLLPPHQLQRPLLRRHQGQLRLLLQQQCLRLRGCRQRQPR